MTDNALVTQFLAAHTAVREWREAEALKRSAAELAESEVTLRELPMEMLLKLHRYYHKEHGIPLGYDDFGHYLMHREGVFTELLRRFGQIPIEKLTKEDVEFWTDNGRTGKLYPRMFDEATSVLLAKSKESENLKHLHAMRHLLKKAALELINVRTANSHGYAFGDKIVRQLLLKHFELSD